MTIKFYCGLKLDMRGFPSVHSKVSGAKHLVRLLLECFPARRAYLLWVIRCEYSRHKVRKTKVPSRGCCHPVASRPPGSGGAEMSSALRVASAFHRKQSLDKIWKTVLGVETPEPGHG